MTELAYMVREDWGRHGTGMPAQSVIVRDWLGDPPYIFAASNPQRLTEPRSADMEFIEYVAGDKAYRIVSIQELRKLGPQMQRFEGTLTVLHPREEDFELLREVVSGDLVARLFVIIWSPANTVRIWLDGLQARDLNTGTAREAPDAVQLEAAKCMVGEQYNGLSTGNGKAAVVQLVRAFSDGGYPLKEEPWLRAFFAAGGQFRHAESVRKLIKEMRQGTRHHIQQRYRPDILSILQERAAQAQTPGD